MSGDKFSQYLTYRAIIKRLLSTVGMWQRERANLWYHFLPVLQITLNLTTVFAIFRYVCLHISDLARATKGLGVLSSFMSSIIKTVCVLANRKDAYKLHQTLDPQFFKLLQHQQYQNVVLRDVTSFKFLSLLLSSFTFLTCVVFVTTPLILVAYQQLHQVYPVKYVLLVPGAYPWAIPPNGFLYRLHYLLESASSIFAIVVSGGIDALFTLYVFQIVGQFRAMSYRITHTKTRQEYFCVLRKCIKQHELIMRCRNTLEKIYGPIILWTMLVNALNLCSQMFEFTQMTNVSIQRAVFFAIYMAFKLVQTFAYAWAGLRLTEESEKYRAAVYASDWHECKPFMTSVLIILAQRPLYLTACNFSIVSINVFVKVVKTSLSYLFALQTLHEVQT